MKGYFFRRSDMVMLISLLILFLGIVLLVYFGSHFSEEALPSTANVQSSSPRHSAHQQVRSNAPSMNYQEEERKVERFFFDPNTADSTQLLRLGLTPFQVKSIYRYRAHGGVYRRVTDFARVPGLTAGQYNELKSYIRISPDFLPADALTEVRQVNDSLRALYGPKKIRSGERIFLNTSDTLMLRRVPGIGSAYAALIYRYGQRLGGYVCVDQLDELPSLPSQLKDYFAIDSTVHPKQLAVNKLSVQALLNHPYINFYQARDIVDYRRKHGRISQLSDLRLFPHFTPSQLQRLAPYLHFE